jgi:acyl-CoA reductase-like NAD-dependent aldehyde dehydrogenase
MTNKDYSALVAPQREDFLSGQTQSASWRRSQLEALKALFQENCDDLSDALWKDLRRNVVDADLMDVAYNVREADYAPKHLAQWMKPERMLTPLVLEPGNVRVRRDPLGVTFKPASHRIADGRYTNGGQICTAPDPQLIRRRSQAQPGLRPDRQSQEFRSPRRPHGERQDSRRRSDGRRGPSTSRRRCSSTCP